MLYDDMDLSRLMLNAEQVEQSHWKKRGRECKKPKPLDQACSSTGRSSFRVKDRPKFQMGHRYLGNPTTSMNTNANGQVLPQEGK